ITTLPNQSKPASWPCGAVYPQREAKNVPISLLDVPLAGVRAPRLIKAAGRLRVEAQITSNGLGRERRYERIPVTRLRPNMIDPELAKMKIEGHRPAGVATSFKPKLAKLYLISTGNRRLHGSKPPGWWRAHK